MRPLAVTVAGLLFLAGCGTSDDRDQARETAVGFYDAVAAKQGSQACDRLAPATADALEMEEKTSCEKAVVSLDVQGGAVDHVEVFLTGAAVFFRNGEVAYLDRHPGAWKVSAAGCKPQGDAPAECELED